MDSWVVGQIAFWYTVYEISPTTVVDKLLTFWLDVTIPGGRGIGGSNWCVLLFLCLCVCWMMIGIRNKNVQSAFDGRSGMSE